MLIPSRSGTGFELRDEAAVLEKFGVPPSGIIDYLALVGDTADNIPGIEGVGPKTAAKLISECGSIDAILANPAAVANENLRRKLVDGAEHLRRNQALVRLLREPPAGASWSDAMLERTAPDFRRIRELAAKLDLHSVIRDLDKIAPESAFEAASEDPDDLFAAASASKPEPAPAAENSTEKKPVSDQLEFDF